MRYTTAFFSCVLAAAAPAYVAGQAMPAAPPAGAPAYAHTAQTSAATTATAAPVQWVGYDGLPWGSRQNVIAQRFPRLNFTNESNDTFASSFQIYEDYENSPLSGRVFVLADETQQALVQVIVHYTPGQTNVQTLVQHLAQRFGEQPKMRSTTEESYVDGTIEKVTVYQWAENDSLIQLNHNQVTNALTAYYTSKAAYETSGEKDSPAWLE